MLTSGPWLSIDDLRRGVEGLPAERLQELALVVEVGEAKVSDLQDWVRHLTGLG